MMILLFAMNSQAQELDLTNIGIEVGNTFYFTVKKNNITNPISDDHQPFFVERTNSNTPSFDNNVTFKMEIISIGEPSTDSYNHEYRGYNASYSYNGTTQYEVSDLSIIRNGLVIATDWNYWLNTPSLAFSGETLISGIYNIKSFDNGDTFTFNLTISTFSPFDSAIKTQNEAVTYDKTTGVITEIIIIKTFYDDSMGVEELLVVQTDSSSYISNTAPGFIFPVISITIILLAVYKKRDLKL